MMVPFVHDNIVDYIPCWIARNIDATFVPCHVAASGKSGKAGDAPDSAEFKSGDESGD